MVTMRAPVDAPPRRAARYNLLSAVEVVNDTTLTYEGWEFAPELCAGGGRLAPACAGNTAEITADTNPSIVEGDVFYVWASDRCSTFQFRTRDFAGRARRQLEAVQSYEIANELWQGGLSLTQPSLNAAGSDTVTLAAVGADVAVGLVEGALGRLTKGALGMIHMTPEVLAACVTAGVVYRDGNLWRSPSGHVIVADAGYTGSGPGNAVPGAGAAGQWIYGTGPVQVRLGEVVVVPGDPQDTTAMAQALDRSDNTVMIHAIRAATWVWDECGHVAALTNVPTPHVGGS